MIEDDAENIGNTQDERSSGITAKWNHVRTCHEAARPRCTLRI